MRIFPPGVGSCVPAPSREKTSLFSSRDIIRRNDNGVFGPSSSLCTQLYNRKCIISFCDAFSWLIQSKILLHYYWLQSTTAQIINFYYKAKHATFSVIKK